ncbi:MAG: SLBB domain-containing protein, partial [Candidatus Omnitrophica bacterium]|nr:SLBB domain-containing protein [Candidatus Omnitrophota bacterium]
MIKRILAFVLMFSFLILQVSPMMAQFPDIEEIETRMEKIQPKKTEVASEEAYRKFKCPSCEREFEIRIDPNDLELKKGIKKIICPYDGTEFYPKVFVEKEEELQYETIRCPNCGREFKGYINVKAILAGQPQILTCPYDKKKFYFKAEGFKPAVFARANLQLVMCPADKRTFKAYIDPETTQELTCPYDGTKFFPTPELIVSQSQPAIAGWGGQVPVRDQEVSNVGIGGIPQQVMASGNAQQPILEEKPSRIEEMFSEHIPLHVSKALKQFGYEIFKPVEIAGVSREEARGGAGAAREDARSETELFRALLLGRQREGVFGGERGVGLSIVSSPAEIPVISDYILGPGDTLMIGIWGQIQEQFPVTIDSEGKILLPKVGPLYLWGLKFSDAEKLIKETMLKAYTKIQVSVSISRLRGIKVFVLGEAQRPGAYTISALSNAFHALYAAGGPTKLGSMRQMKLIRKGSPQLPIDLYNIFLKGDNTQDYKLQGGDTIFIPAIGDVVGVAGNVKRPAIYELKEKVRLSDIIEMAGGFSPVGYLQRLQLERIQEHIRKTVLDLEFSSVADLKNSPNNLELQDGDLVLVFPITPLRYNFVSITGNILRPGDYELKQGMRLKDLLDKAGGLLPGAYLDRAEVARFKGDQTREIIPISLAELLDGRERANITLKEWDVITVYAKKDILPTLFVEIDGAVNKPGKYELTENMRVSDLIFRAGGLKRNASKSTAELFRGSSNLESKLVNVDLSKVLSKDTEEFIKYDLPLEEGDHLFIREDVAKEEKLIITLSGEFKYPGKYAVEKGTRLSEVIERAGGFTKNAFLDGTVYARESVRIAQQKMLKNFIDSEQRALLQEQSSLAIGLTPAQAES